MDWIASIKEDEEITLKKLYKEQRDYCISILRNQMGLSANDAVEVFQRSICILYDNVMAGKLVELTSTIRSYLMGICRNQARQFKREQSKYLSLQWDQVNGQKDNDHEEEIKEELFEAMFISIEELGDPCKTLLEHFYYRRWSMVKIAEDMGYKNKNSAKNQKFKCLKRLQKIAFKHMSSRINQ